MYIDSLTVVALIVFVIAVAAFIGFCLVRVCGLIETDREDKEGGLHHGERV